MKRTILLIALGALLAACSSVEGERRSNILIPGRTLNVSPSLTIPAEALAVGAALYLVIDPLAPNWQVGEERLADSRFRIALRMKRFTTGGEGEAMQVFRRAAERIVRDNGRAGYVVVDFSEGIESTVPFAQRVAHGVVELLPAR